MSASTRDACPVVSIYSLDSVPAVRELAVAAFERAPVTRSLITKGTVISIASTNSSKEIC